MASVSVRDVAALAGVSVGTVSNVLNRPSKVTKHTVDRVHSAIEALGFVRNDAARQLRAGRSRSIGLIVLDVANPFFTDVARGAEVRAAQGDLTVLLGNSDENVDRERAYLDLFDEQRVHGVLISPIGDVLSRLDQLRQRGIPTVLVDHHSDTKSFSSVAVDDVAGGHLAVNHLMSLGRTRIAFVSGPHTIRQVADRLSGARMAASGRPDVTLEILEAETLTVSQGRRVADSIRERRPALRPDAIFAANDLLALGIQQGLVGEPAIRIPDDIALIGYDDIAFAASAVVPLTSIRQPSEQIGFTAVDLLIREVGANGEFEREHVVFRPELVVRASTEGMTSSAVEKTDLSSSAVSS